MQIQNISPTNFQGIRMQTSKMNATQKSLCDRFIDHISYTDAYMQSLDSNIDLYLLPIPKSNKIKVTFIDKISDMFFLKNGSKARIEIPLSHRMIINSYARDERVPNYSDPVENTLNDILSDKIKRPTYNYKKILNSKTDVAKLRPEHYEYLHNETNEFSSLQNNKDRDDQFAPEILDF